jgi:hypothetical protein
MCANTTSGNNTAVGAYALRESTTTDLNVAVGFCALIAKTNTGHDNTAIGACSQSKNTEGFYNTSVGKSSLVNVTTGDNNIALGRDSGNDAMINITTEDNRLVLGNNSVSNSYVKVDWTVTSDARDKTNFGSVPHGLDFVNELEPVSFQFKKSREDDTPTGNVRYGFKAQDILALEKVNGGNNVIIDDEFEDALKLTGGQLVPILVNAIKELSETNKDLKSRIEALETS